jgi:hypothetical protein
MATRRSLPFDHLLLWFLLTAASGLGLAAMLCAAPPADEPDEVAKSATETAARKKQREENLKAMQSRVSRMKVRTAGERTDAELITTPVLHYTDEPRRIIDATLWGWVAEGRLLAVCKIEYCDRKAHPFGPWLSCFGSLASGRIDAEWSGGRRWSARKPGIEMQTIDLAPAAAGGQIARLREMKTIASRFKATITEPQENNREEMRLLPRPVYRYESPTRELLDGAVFGLTKNGTNPDAILVLELNENKAAAPVWKFGVAGMTAGELSVKFDDTEVWSKPAAKGTGSFDTWVWFWEQE